MNPFSYTVQAHKTNGAFITAITVGIVEGGLFMTWLANNKAHRLGFSFLVLRNWLDLIFIEAGAGADEGDYERWIKGQKEEIK